MFFVCTCTSTWSPHLAINCQSNVSNANSWIKHCLNRGHRLHSVLIIPLTQCSFLFFRSNPVHGEVYSLQHYVIKFVSDLRQVGGFLRVLRFPPPIKLTYINEILLTVAETEHRFMRLLYRTLQHGTSNIKTYRPSNFY
jgi:hypothetical protein